MSPRLVGARPAGARLHLRLGGLALLVLFLQSACATAIPPGGHSSGFRADSLAPALRERCVYVPRRYVASGALNGAFHATRAGVEVVPVAAALGAASPAAPLTPPASPPLEGLSGEGLGDGIPRGVLRLVPEGGTTAGKAGPGVSAGELIVTAGAVVAAAGSVLLLCLTVDAALDGSETPIDIADEFYGTHVGDLLGGGRGQYSSNAPNGAGTRASQAQMGPGSAPLAPPSASPRAEPGRDTDKRRGRIYVTYTKLNKNTHRYYSGRTSMVVDLAKSLREQAALAVIFRDMDHHLDENDEPKDAVFKFAEVDQFDVGAAIDYGRRYDDAAYWRIRGREQQLIDFHGGAQSDTGKPYRTENVVRGVAKDNPWGRRFHDAATERWGQFHPYTGY